MNLITEEVKIILETLKCGVSITDAEGRFIYINKSCQEMFLTTEEEVLGKTGHEIEAERIFYPSLSLKALSENRKILDKQVNRKGQEYLVTAIPVYDSNKNIQAIIAYSAWDFETTSDLIEKYNELKVYNSRIKKSLLQLKNSYCHNFDKMIANDIRTQNNINILTKMADNDLPVFISGQNGTGKTYLAHLMHQRSSRGENIFTVIDLKSIPDEKIEEEIFGSQNNVGILELCKKGTLVIKNPELMPKSVQSRLSLAIKNKSYIDYEGNNTKLDLKLVLSSTAKTIDLVEKHGMLTEFYYTMCVVSIETIPLNERPDDLYDFIMYYTDKYNNKYKKSVAFSDKAINEMLRYSWENNIAEIKHTINKLILNSDKNILHDFDLPKNISRESTEYYSENMDLKIALELYESKIINRAFERFHTTTDVARCLNISQPTAVRKIQKYVSNYRKDDINEK